MEPCHGLPKPVPARHYLQAARLLAHEFARERGDVVAALAGEAAHVGVPGAGQVDYRAWGLGHHGSQEAPRPAALNVPQVVQERRIGRHLAEVAEVPVTCITCQVSQDRARGAPGEVRVYEDIS